MKARDYKYFTFLLCEEITITNTLVLLVTYVQNTGNVEPFTLLRTWFSPNILA